VDLGSAIGAILSSSESRAKDLLALEWSEVDFEGSKVKPKGKTVYFLSLMV